MHITIDILTSKLDLYQTREQAGFRAGYGTNDYLQVIKTLIEKSVKYEKPLILIFVDYEKALVSCRIDHRYITIFQHIYENATASVRLHENTRDFNIERGLHQGDVIFKLFITLLEYMFRQIKFGDKGINIDGEKLNHLRFTIDVVLIADQVDDAKSMRQSINENRLKHKQIKNAIYGKSDAKRDGIH